MRFDIESIYRESKKEVHLSIKNEDKLVDLSLQNYDDYFLILESIFESDVYTCELQVETIENTPDGDTKNLILSFDGKAYLVTLLNFRSICSWDVEVVE